LFSGMKNVPPIVAGIDFSSSSAQVLAHAAKISAASGASLIAAHVVPASVIKQWEDSMGSEASTTGRVEEMTGRMEALVEETIPGAPVVIEVCIGDPHKALAEIIRHHAADLLVLGAHDVSKRRLGSVAARCARSAPADVLLLRDWQGRFFRRIAACVDFSKSSAAVLERSIALAAAHEATLEIIHVIFPPTRDPWGEVMDQPMDSDTSYETLVRERARRRMDDFLEPFADRLSEIQTSIVFLDAESPAAAITAHVDAELVDLTVTGSREGSWVADFVLGSNAERMLHDSSSSVLIVRG
jgi:nucleotide-binding universal stress UspA family protein